ncbi:aminopeptidase [Candidatus Omnitrophota bacterium]
MNKKIAIAVIHKCFGFKKGEHVLIVADDTTERLAQTFYKAAQKEKIDCLLLKIPPLKMHGQEPPKEVAAALKVTDIAILLTAMSLSHTKARKLACTKYGTRIASLPGITEEICNRSLELNYTKLKKRVKKAARQFNAGKKLEIYTNKGTELTMSIQGQAGFSDHGLYTWPGAFGNLPAGEACIAPCEGTTNGRLVIDASAPLVGRLKRPKEIIIKDGLIQNMPIQAIAKAIKPLGKCALNVAEIGLGFNPRAKVTGNILEDEKAERTGHLAIGANISFGGKVSCPCHLDFVFFNPRVLIDGRRMA